MTMTAIKCNGQGTAGTHSHDSVQAVRACYAGATVAATREERVAPAPTFIPATAKQTSFALSLGTDRVVPVAGSTDQEARHIARLEDLAGGKDVSKKEASDLIGWLLTLPKPAPTAKASAGSEEPIAAGMYHQEGVGLFRVYFGQQSGQMLAKKVVGSVEEGYSFEYAGKAARFVKGARRLTLEEAKAWGKATGTCCVCSRRLDVPESVDAGIGPVCANKEGFWG